MSIREPRWFGWALLALCCVPGLVAAYGVGSDLLLGTRHFGSNPIKAGEHFLGDWTLRFLVATLAVTPLRQLTGLHWLARHRRKLGLAAFAYLMLHWLVYALLDVQLDWGELLRDLAKRPYIMIGMTGLVLMIPLAVTSTQNMMRKLGRRWTTLHRLVYVIAFLGTMHFWMSVKKDVTEPAIYAAIFAVLGLYRLVQWRRRWLRARPAMAAGCGCGAPQACGRVVEP
ncbi:MAG: sulfoxide reductase heme-binding subunit YedZ [Gammaproteobacteria bacterium]|nr:sulfoxide reductase heme-binding subunit YedZ [Gammaproteobacteria bacterium]MBI5619128.1 sulfoxide reductase heme-binding subunit YedZ [Gammaproteobacteria bacterium]